MLTEAPVVVGGEASQNLIVARPSTSHFGSPRKCSAGLMKDESGHAHRAVSAREAQDGPCCRGISIYQQRDKVLGSQCGLGQSAERYSFLEWMTFEWQAQAVLGA